MRTALSLILISFLFSTCANRAAVNCEDSWTVPVNRANPLGFGVNIHFTNPQPGEIEMIAAAGFNWVRMDFVWAVTEKRRGVYDFSDYDRLMTSLERNHLRALFILDYGNPLYYGGQGRAHRSGAPGICALGRGGSAALWRAWCAVGSFQ
jgi:hypothetical protein